MSMLRPIPSMFSIRPFARDEQAVAAVEFALILPVMLTLYLGGVEVTQAVSIDRKVTLVSHTVADLTAQKASVNASYMTNVFAAGAAVVAPYDATPLKSVVSSVKIDATTATKKATIEWSQANATGTARTKNSVVTSLIPTALMDQCTLGQTCYLVWGESSYTYKPTIGYVVTGTLTLTDTIFLTPRIASAVTFS